MSQTHKNDRDRFADVISCRAFWRFKNGFVVASIIVIVSFCFLIVHNVSGKITPEDTIALKKIMKSVEKGNISSFSKEIQLIRDVQDAVLDASPTLLKIPLRQTREPQDLLDAGHGQCSDRGRTIEKALKYYGFDVRFVSVFSRNKTFIPPETMAIDSGNDLRSHALVEVKTSRGWMFVDTNERWLALDSEDNPVSLDTWKNVQNKDAFQWSPDNVGDIYWLLRREFTIIYGLYTRHGQFYPPYTPYVPDMNIQTMVKGHLLSW